MCSAASAIDVPVAHSYVSGTPTYPLLGMTIGESFDQAVRKNPDGLALVMRSQGIRWTYAQLAEQVDRFACGLVSLGLNAGDRVGIWSPNNVEWVITQFATAKLGLVLVCINPAYRPEELKYALKKVGCSALVTATQFKSSHYIEMLYQMAPAISTQTPGDLKLKDLPDLHTIIQINQLASPGFISFDSVSDRGQFFSIPTVKLKFDDAINIQFTSGTTGSPKGATLSHHNILNNGYFCGQGMALTAQDKLCIPVPFYHCFGLVLSNLACISHGAAMIIPSESFDALSVLEAIQAEHCTALHGVPTMFISILEHPDFHTFDLSSLRTGMMAGAPCPMDVMRRIISDLGMTEITFAYGMTETSPISFQTSRDDVLERRVSTVGLALPHIEAKVVDDVGNIVPRGVPGQICIRGYSVMLGYWGDAEKTAEVLDANGWMHTGDIATLDSNGYCNITGRIKDMVIRGGENIYPKEIEEFLSGHPAIGEVQVFGVPDSKFGEEICAWVRLKEDYTLDEEAVKIFCRGSIAHYKIPRYIRFVSAFPMTVSGKVQKFSMREVMINELGLSEIKTA